jgi:NAD(P)-dependent dehydrogenase (short-subunit alcohol dehydrogenase family)
MANYDMNDKVVFVTGAGKGIGRATAKRFGEAGASVVVSDHTTEDQKLAVVDEIEDAGGEAMFIKADASDPGDMKALVEETVDTYGQLDYAINNAATSERNNSLVEKNPDEFREVFELNMLGTWAGMREEIPAILETGGGAIVNTASTTGLTGVPGLEFYSSSKHAVLGLTKSAAIEFAPDNIRINAVCPNFIMTQALADYYEANPEQEESEREKIPMDRFGDPEEVASAIVWLVSDEASYMTGESISIEGGKMAGL